MSVDPSIEALYREFTDALTEVLAENAVGLARRGRLARARATVKRHPDYTQHAYFMAVETAFVQWEALQEVLSRGISISDPRDGAETQNWIAAHR